jgi:hypothetical protein
MRRRLLALLVVAAALGALVMSGCGSSSSKKPADATATSLSYFPAQTPFVITVATKPSANAAAQENLLKRKLPMAQFGESALKSRLQQLGINYDQDVKPLYANPVVFGDESPSINAFQDNFLIVWVTKDEGKLNALLKKVGHLQSAGSHDGAKLYTTSGGALAVTGPTILFAKTLNNVTVALDRHASGGGVTSAQYNAALAGLPQDAAIHLFGSLSQILSTPQTAKARRIPWVAALRSYGVTFGYSQTGVTMQFRLDTGGTSLTSAQLPFAEGGTPPSVVAGLPIQAGLRDPSQIVSFVESAEQATSPQSYARFLKQEAKFRAKTGIDVNTLARQFQGDLVADSDSRTTLLRAAVSHPPLVSRFLAKVAKGAGGGPTKIKAVGGGFYQLSQGGRAALASVIGNQLVVGIPPHGGRIRPATLRSFASAPGAPLPGGSGALSFRISIPQLLAITQTNTSNAMARQIIALLGDLSGSMTATTGALTGSATLAIK